MNSSRVRRPIAIALALAILTLLGGAPGAAASSGSIANVHGAGEQVQATFTVISDTCIGSYCGWFPVAYEYPASRQCAPDGDHPIWVGESYKEPGTATATESFYPSFAGPIRLCLYVSQGGGDSLLAQTVYRPPATTPGHISFNRRCYREGDNVHVTGRGFKQGDVLSLSFSRGHRDDTVLTNKRGRFAYNLDAPDISSGPYPPPMQRRVAVGAKEYSPIVPGGPTASGSFLVTTVGVATSPSLPLYGDIPRRVSFILSGFDSGRTIYAHWIHRNHSVGTYKLGRAHGPCGEMRTPRMPFRDRIDGRGGWTIQFDQGRSYDSYREPQATLSFSVFTVAGRLLTR